MRHLAAIICACIAELKMEEIFNKRKIKNVFA